MEELKKKIIQENTVKKIIYGGSLKDGRGSFRVNSKKYLDILRYIYKLKY